MQAPFGEAEGYPNGELAIEQNVTSMLSAWTFCDILGTGVRTHEKRAASRVIAHLVPVSQAGTRSGDDLIRAIYDELDFACAMTFWTVRIGNRYP